ncbi:hypothetical protein Bca52824_077059 [Brassica carinata]|uniref:Retrotransposon gag domain-containing protein n=1 Tax=Brassica carinata TaxID=52824 RepID=A0A8X7PU74_BRACI|nr:hypothetical protein Bca52824_077059 [Brassica carinata]
MIREAEGVFGARIEALETKLENQSEKLVNFDQHIADIADARLIVLRKTPRRLVTTGNRTLPPLMNPDPGRGRGGLIPHYSGMTRLSKLDFPRFSGEGLKDWLCKVEQFFHGSNTAELKVGIASMHFDGLAATWHRAVLQSENHRNLLQDWRRM